MSQQTEQATTERMRVDPLAALRAAATFALAYHLPNSAEDFEKAGAAVAELVAAAKAYQAVSGVAPTFGEVRDARKRLFAALAPFSEPQS